MILEKDHKILLLLRKDNFKYSFPAGKVERNENASNAACRELSEELGIKVSSSNLRRVHCMYFKRSNKIVYKGIFFKILKKNFTVKLMEPDKHINFRVKTT